MGDGVSGRIRHNLHALAARLAKLNGELPIVRKTILTAVGVQVQSWGFQDFRERARGAAAGGLSWTPIGELAIAGRLLKRKAGEKILRMLPGGASGVRRKQRAAILATAVFGPLPPVSGRKQKPAVRQRVQARRRALQAFARQVKKEFARHEIGVDTGRLVNSLAFGKGGKNVPGQVFQIQGKSVIVGTIVSYAKNFDGRRPIFGAQFIDGGRKKSLEKLAHDAYDLAIRKAIGGAGT